MSFPSDTGSERGRGGGGPSSGPPSPPGGTGPGWGAGAPWLMIAISGGALSAVFLSGMSAPSIFSFVMFFLVPAPLFVVGLAFGWMAAGIAAFSALALLAAMLGPAAALMHALLAGAPVTWLTHLAARRRPAAGSMEGEPVDEDGMEWYPEGRLLLWMAGLSAGAVIISLLTQGTTLEDIRASLMAMAGEAMRAMQMDGELTDEQKKRFLETFATLAPLSAAVLWEVALFISFRLSVWLGWKFGLSRRPPADFARLAFPQKALLGLAGVSLVALAPGLIGHFGQIAALAFMAAFAILGLSVIHAWVRGKPWEPAALGVTYSMLIALTGLAGPALLLLGLAEAGFGVREAMLRGGGGGPPAKT